MAGFIVLADGRAWSAANWAYDEAIRCIAAELDDGHGAGALQEWLLQQTCAECGPGLGSVDVRELTPENRARFEEAALHAVVSVAELGAAGWAEPSVFPAWLERFKLLAQLVGSVRAGDDPHANNPLMRGLLPPTGSRVGPGW